MATVSHESPERDRQEARQAVLAMIVWALLWTGIITFLFLFGHDLSAAIL